MGTSLIKPPSSGPLFASTENARTFPAPTNRTRPLFFTANHPQACSSRKRAASWWTGLLRYRPRPRPRHEHVAGHRKGAIPVFRIPPLHYHFKLGWSSE